jgi:F-type H+-transporting ATPase subunit epsilon
MPLLLEIVTPEKKVFSGTVANVYLPAEEGEMGVLPMHTALVTALRPGELRYETEGRIEAMAIGSGFVEVTQEKVSVLTDMAMHEIEIDESRVEEAMKRAHEALAKMQHDSDAEEVAHLQAVIAKSMAQLNLKRKNR